MFTNVDEVRLVENEFVISERGKGNNAGKLGTHCNLDESYRLSGIVFMSIRVYLQCRKFH